MVAQSKSTTDFQGVNTTSDFKLVDRFLGYRNKEDNTNLPPGYLTKGSQNVIVNTAGRLSSTPGYTLDGSSSTIALGIICSHDCTASNGKEIHIRGGNSALQARHEITAGSPTWDTFWTSSTSVACVFADWWNETEKKSSILFVNGDTSIYEWTGAFTTFASATTNTLTKQGTTTWAQDGFFSVVSGRAITINGTTYTYTGGEDTTTLTGVSPDPTSAGYAVGTLIQQGVRVTGNSGITGISSTMTNTIISTLNQHVYLGSSTLNTVFYSKTNTFTDFSYTSPVANVGDGALFVLDAPPNALIPQEETMVIHAGRNWIYNIQFKLSSDLTNESVTVSPVKFSCNQATLSQALCSKVKNDVVFVTHDQTLDTLGRIENILGTQQTTIISDPIRNDFDSYDFTGGSVFYFQNRIYVAVPKEGLYRIYNMQPGIDATGTTIMPYWEAPQTVSISRFSVIDGALYGHSSLTMETYKMNDGYNFNGHRINAKAVFSWQNYGMRYQTKYFDEYYVEGYISPNTTLTSKIKYDIDGCATDYSVDLSGSNSQVVCLYGDNNSIGKYPIGTQPFGMNLQQQLSTDLPPKFRVIFTMPRTDFYEAQYSFETDEIDSRWEILAFGPLVTKSMYGSNVIKI